MEFESSLFDFHSFRVSSYVFPLTQVNKAVFHLSQILPVSLMGRVMALRLYLIISAPLVVF